MTAGSPPLLPGETIAPAPRGWDALAQLPPLQGRSCRWCGAPAIVGTLNGYRCADHPPVRGDARGDWGWGFNWAPTERTGRCLPSRCYCGRCPQYDPTGEPSGLSVRELRALRASMQRMLECST